MNSVEVHPQLSHDDRHPVDGIAGGFTVDVNPVELHSTKGWIVCG
jgi:hypothetical protein